MRILLQKVTDASVSVDGTMIGKIGRGYLLFIGIMAGDSDEQARWLTEKILGLRLFEGENGKINDRSIRDIGGQILAVSQFTLAGDFSKGNRPDYTAAAERSEARRLYDYVVDRLKQSGLTVATGEFGADMRVSLVNDGPVTLVLEQ